MPRGKLLFLFVTTFLFIILLPKVCLANSSLILYKFSSFSSNDDWVIIFNNGNRVLDLSDYLLEDGAGNKKDKLDCFLKSNGYYTIDWGKILNNDGDTIYLKDKANQQIIDCVSYGKGKNCGERSVDLPKLEENEYGVRVNDRWEKTNDGTKANNADNCLSSTNTPILTLSPAPISTSAFPSPTSAPKATLRIEAKNENGVIFTDNDRVKIYVDDVYIHHYSPETLTFCNGCQCNGYVDCGFGNHLIKLEKSGYADWEGRITIEVGGSYVLDPEMTLVQTEPTATPTPTKPVSSPTPTKPVPSVSPTSVLGLTMTPLATDSSEENFAKEIFLGEEGEVMGEKEDISSTASFSQKRFGNNVLPLILIGLGISMIGVYFWLNKKGKENYSDETEVEEM